MMRLVLCFALALCATALEVEKKETAVKTTAVKTTAVKTAAAAKGVETKYAYPNHVASWKELYLMQRKAIASAAASSMEKHDSHHSEVVNSKALAEAHAALPAGAPRFQKKGKKFVRRVPEGARAARVRGSRRPPIERR
jgi:hypothetical protein